MFRCLLTAIAVIGLGAPLQVRADSNTFAELEALIRTAPERAKKALDLHDLVPADRLRLEGLLAATNGDHQQAYERFDQAFAITSSADSALALHLAHAALHSGHADRGLAVIATLKKQGNDGATQRLLEARLHQAMGNIQAARTCLDEAARRFGNSDEIVLEQVVLDHNNQLWSSARSRVEARLALPLSADLALAMLSTLRNDNKALHINEAIAKSFPRNASIQAQLAYAYAVAGLPRAAAHQFAKACNLGQDHALAAADQFRLAHDTAHALEFNATVSDDKQRLTQRLEILFEANAFGRITLLAPALEQAGALTDRARYQLAYAHLRLGERMQSQQLLELLRKGPYQAQAEALLFSITGTAQSKDAPL